MGFSHAQLRALARRVPARRVKTRVADNGKELSYIEGWFVLNQANRIFGFDGWDRETIETHCILTREERNGTVAAYSARVRLTVRTAGSTIIREGHGTGEARAAAAGEAHDHALKAAETDATKRALATFGPAFGLLLHSKPPCPRKGVTAKTVLRESRSPADISAVPATTLPAAASRPASQNVASPQPATKPAPSGARGIDKSVLTFSEPKRQRSRDHLRFVAAQPCILCGTTPSDAHHLRFAQPRAMSRKVSDEFVVPLCRAHHRELHLEGNEASWWHDMAIDPLPIARDLWAESGRTDTAALPAPR